jgi:hypothetical protein
VHLSWPNGWHIEEDGYPQRFWPLAIRLKERRWGGAVVYPRVLSDSIEHPSGCAYVCMRTYIHAHIYIYIYISIYR